MGAEAAGEAARLPCASRGVVYQYYQLKPHPFKSECSAVHAAFCQPHAASHFKHAGKEEELAESCTNGFRQEDWGGGGPRSQVGLTPRFAALLATPACTLVPSMSAK